MNLLSTFLNGFRSKPRLVDEDIEITEETFGFFEKIKPQLEGLETFRKKKLASFEYRKKIGVPIGVVLTPPCAWIDWMLLMWQRGSDDSGAGVTFLMLGGLYAWVTKPKRDYAKEYKVQVLPKVAKLIGNMNYTLDGHVDIDRLKESKIVPSHDRFQTEDHFVGKYKGVEIDICEIDFQQRRRNKNRTYYASVFKGLQISITLPEKKFFGHTVLQENKSGVLEWFKEKSSGLQKANLVDPEFEKVFDCYTNDQVEARYIIDPAMIETLKALHLEYNGETLLASYYDERYFLALIKSKHDYFEPASIYVPAVRPETIQDMRNEIEQVLKIVDKLELYDADAVHKQAA